MCIRGSIQQRKELVYIDASLNLKLITYLQRKINSSEEAIKKCRSYGPNFHMAHEMRKPNILKPLLDRLAAVDTDICIRDIGKIIL